jgi:predicted secreted protein
MSDNIVAVNAIKIFDCGCSFKFFFFPWYLWFNGSSRLFGKTANQIKNNINSNISIFEKNSGSTMKDSAIESNPEELRYKKGQTFSIGLKSFATMGYRWNITNNYNTTVIRYIDHAFQLADPKVIGGPTSEIFNFETLNTGSTILKFSNVRGLQEKPEEERVYFIKVIE